MRTVLVSVTDKTGLDSFLKRLERFDSLKVIATTSTAAYLQEKGFDCKKVEELTGFPEILSGRVKTLHPRVFAGILSRPSKEDRSCLEEMEISEIDLVVVNLYAFEDKLKQGLPEEKMIEQIDVGGVALLRAAAKNFERVAVISSPDQYDRVIADMDRQGGQLSHDDRRQLAYEAFLRTSSYDASISAYVFTQMANTVDLSTPPDTLTISLRKHQALRYGENPHQAAAWYLPARPAASVTSTATFPPFEQLQGKELSANNITDVFSLVKILRDIGSPGACIIKHNNPCGVAMGKDLNEAYDKAYKTDPLSAFGGVYGLTGKVDGPLATKIAEGFIEIVLAPDFDAAALEVFKKKKNVRVLKMRWEDLKPVQQPFWHMKDYQDFGILLEKDIEAPVNAADFRCVTENKLDKSYAADIAFAWSVVKHLTSNAIFVAREGLGLGFGIGQTSRIASVEHALKQAGSQAKGAVLASDAFFPATDNIEAAAEAGIKVIIQPGGSLKDEDVIAACNKHAIVMLFTGQRCFKH